MAYENAGWWRWSAKSKGKDIPAPTRAPLVRARAQAPVGVVREGVARPYHRKERDLHLQGRRDPQSQPSPTVGRRKTPVARRARGGKENALDLTDAHHSSTKAPSISRTGSFSGTRRAHKKSGPASRHWRREKAARERGALRPDSLSRDGELGCKECGDVRSGVRKFAVSPLAQ